MRSFNVTAEESGLTVGDILRKRGVSRRLLTRLKRTADGILLNERSVFTNVRASVGDTLCINEDDKANENLKANTKLNVPVLYEDGDVIVFDKPKDMPVHQSIKHREDTLANCFAHMCPDMTFRPVNRLDRDTLGCVAVAKNAYAASFLQGNISKVYSGLIPFTELGGGRVCAPIARERESIILRCVRDDGQYSATTWQVTQRRDDCALCRFIPETGRTHQIRVHMAHIGLPLLGDGLYGGDCTRIQGQALMCSEVTFALPCTHEIITVRSCADLFGQLDKKENSI